MTHPNASTAMAEVVVDELLRGGVRHLVASPGSRSAALGIAAARRPDMHLVIVIDERSAAFHALGIGRVTGRPAAVLTTSGSAVANLFPAVVEADTGMVPLLLLTADRPPELHGVGANQTIEQGGLFGEHVRWSAAIGPAEHERSSNDLWRWSVCEAVDRASDGPVHVNLAFREPVVPETDDGRDVDRPFRFPTDGRPDGGRWASEAPRRRWIAPLTERWTDPERGVVVVGEAPFVGVAEVDRLAASLGWPLIAEPTAGGRPPQTISTAHHLLADPVLRRRMTPDVALVIGRANLSRSVSEWLADVPTLMVDPRLTRSPRPSAELAVGWPLLDGVRDRTGDWRSTWLRVESVARRALDAWLDEAGVVEPRVARDVADAVPEGAILVAASSMPIRDLDLTMRPSSIEVLSNRGASGIDGFVSTAFGVAAGSGRPVVALGGDLAMLHDSNGFLAEPRADVVFVVVNNDGGGIFSFLPQVRQDDVFERLFGTPHGRSFALLASFHGVRYELLTDVSSQVGRALDEGGVWMLEAVTDRRANPSVHRSLTEHVASVVRDSVEG